MWRPSTRQWLIVGLDTVTHGLAGDIPVPVDLDCDGRFDRAVWRPSTGAWDVYGFAPVSWGLTGDVPLNS